MKRGSVLNPSRVLLFRQIMSPISLGGRILSVQRGAAFIESRRPTEILSCRRRGLIEVPSLEKIYPGVTHQIDNAVLLRYTTGPCTGCQILQWLRFANSSERIAQYVFNELDNSKRRLSIILYPVLQVLYKLWLKDGFAIFIRQGRPRLRVHLSSSSVLHP